MTAVFCWLLCCPKCNETTAHQWLHLLSHLPAPECPQQPALFYVLIEDVKSQSVWFGVGHGNPLFSLFSHALATRGACYNGRCHSWVRASLSRAEGVRTASRNPGDENSLDSWDSGWTLLGVVVVHGDVSWVSQEDQGWSKEWPLDLERV